MSQTADLSETFLRAALEILGPRGCLTAPEDITPYVEDWRGRETGQSPMVARPASTDECARFMILCAEHGVAITPQGGNSGLVLGGLAHGEVVISTARMKAIRDIDPLNDSLTVEAGVILADVQAAAEGAGRLFPLSLASEGQAQIGGLISTNAGGVNVLRYGMMRDLVMGIEAVLPDGRIWNGLTALRKDNTAYDLKQLFIGGEGTLGVVTAATLKLYPQPAVKAVAWLAVESPQAAVELLAMARQETGGAVSSFELMPRIGVDFVMEEFSQMRDPLPDAGADWYVLMEVSFSRKEGASELMQSMLEQAFERGFASDGVLAQNEAQARDIWHIRESLPLAEKAFGRAVKHDISVPVSSIPAFLERGGKLVQAIAPDANLIAFGHVGDGNLHYNVAPPVGMDDTQFVKQFGKALTGAIHDLVCQMNGSISAEHGIGLQKRDDLAARISPVELDMLRAVKRALDPDNRMNPGRMVDVG
ncbi:MAG: hydroxyacid dehydrogenase [Hirschia sp.]|mgnify:CR=1 FL=1|nr:hydroxyacid dehydrogenase [Hirschia sp.]MBF18202.1 hydroxyacid dehydrogenase [Hirschia sp.]|tara:strand:+ start:511 stop:1941 length:1431 start_codon:yes stop_codon:yes gene_type:complete